MAAENTRGFFPQISQEELDMYGDAVGQTFYTGAYELGTGGFVSVNHEQKGSVKEGRGVHFEAWRETEVSEYPIYTGEVVWYADSTHMVTGMAEIDQDF